MKTQILAKDYIAILKRKIRRRNIAITFLVLLLVVYLILTWPGLLLLLMGIAEGSGLIF